MCSLGQAETLINKCFHVRTKHIHNVITEKLICTPDIPIAKRFADMFTKVIPSTAF